MHFKFRNQKHIKHAEAFVRLMNDDRAAGLRTGEKLGMVDPKRTPIAHVDGERKKRLGAMHVFQLLDSHFDILAESFAA